MPDSPKIVNIKQKNRFNIGVLIFLIILIYTLYFVVNFFVTEHISAYEVMPGSIVQDSTYTALCLRDESVCYSQGSGIINYYAGEGDRIGVKTLVYSLDENGTIGNIFASESGDATEYLTRDRKSVV